jgi:hypoxanthine-DNA glycosylase
MPHQTKFIRGDCEEVNKLRPELLHSLPPSVATDCRVLVLGSMPGAASLTAANYYAHPRNRFWPLMGALCDFDSTLPYAERIAALHHAGVGLWDVIGQCERRGSLDADIVPGSEVPNAILPLLASLPQLRLVVFNGNKAAQAFRRHLQVEGSAALAARIDFCASPSTSPANAGFGFERLLVAWRVIQAGRY